MQETGCVRRTLPSPISMQKHREITERRIEMLVRTLKQAFLGEPSPLGIEFCAVPHPSQQAAVSGPWKPVSPGFAWGPAYRTVWFRATGTVPRSWGGKTVAAVLELGGERTIWKSNQPVWGLDSEHSLFRIAKAARGGEKVDLMIEAYGGNPDVRVHGTPPPRAEQPFRFETAELRCIDLDLWEFWLDVQFAFLLMKNLPEGDAAREHLLRGLNDAANIFNPAKRESLQSAKKSVKEATAARRVDRYHSVTPLGHAHLDTAWLWPLDITMKKMAHTTAIQLALMDQYPDYVFVHSQPAQYEWLEQQHPKLFERVKQKIAKNQWEPIGSLWIECDTNIPNGESLVRQILYGKRYFAKKLDTDSKTLWLPDCFGYSAALPQIMKKAGIEQFVTQKISWNQFNKFPHNTFWWEGIDGSRIWTHFPPSDTYTGDCDPAQLRKHLTANRDHARSDFGLYIFGQGDGGGGPTAENIEMLMRASRATSMPQIEWRKAAEFFEEARAKSKDLQSWVGELYFELHRGTYTSQAKTKKQNRECEFALRDLEWLCAFGPKFPTHYPGDEIQKLWKLVLLNQFHDILPGSSVTEVYRDSQKDYAHVLDAAGKMIQGCLDRHSETLDTSKTQKPCAMFTSADVSTEARIRAPKGAAPTHLICGEETLPVQMIEEFGEKYWIFKTPEAALGSVCIADFRKEPFPAKPRLKATQRRLENDTWGVQFDGHGNITSILSLEDQTEYVEPGKLANLFQIFDDVPLFWDAWDVDIYALETGHDLIRCEREEIVERGPVRAAIEVEKRFGESRIVQRISLGPTPGIRFDTMVDWRESNKMLKVAFPVNVHCNRATFEIQFGNVERPTHRNTTWDMARFEVCAQKWIDLSEGDHGVALLNDSKYGFDVLGNTMRMTLLRSPKSPDPECDMGIHKFSYALLPHYGSYNWSGVVQAAYALNLPLRWRFVGKHEGAAPALQPFVECSDCDIVIESVKKSEDGNDIIVRLYECHNARGRAALKIARKFKRAFLCDLMESEIEQLEVRGGVVEFDFAPFEILTIKFVL